MLLVERQVTKPNELLKDICVLKEENIVWSFQQCVIKTRGPNEFMAAGATWHHAESYLWECVNEENRSPDCNTTFKVPQEQRRLPVSKVEKKKKKNVLTVEVQLLNHVPGENNAHFVLLLELCSQIPQCL